MEEKVEDEIFFLEELTSRSDITHSLFSIKDFTLH